MLTPHHLGPMGDDVRAAHRIRLLHELRTPLTVLSGRVQLLRRKSSQAGRDIAPTVHDLATLEAAIARLAAAVDDVERELIRPDGEPLAE